MSSRATSGGIAAREAVLRWSLRMFRREWRQQILICLLVAAAVAVTIFAAGIISGAQVPQNAGYGSANQLAALSGQDPHLNEELGVLRAHFGPLGMIDSVTVSTGTVSGATLETLDPHGPYVGPLVQLASGRYPTARDEVDLTSALTQLYGTRVGGTWVADGTTWHVVGEIRSPTDLNATTALAAPGAIAHPATVTALFDATQSQLASFLPPKAIYATLIGAITPKPGSPGLNIGEILLLVAATFGMLFIGLIAVAGFTVLAHRRTRAIGMLGALGADESTVRLALLVNGLVVGLASMLLGGVVGLVGWWVYAPHQQASVGHVVDPAAIPWWVVVVALLLAPVTTTLAASRPARATARLPVVAALSGRPTEPKASRRNAAVGAGILAGGFVIVFAGGAAGHGGNGGSGAGVLSVLLGIVLASIGLFMVAQWIVAQLGRLATRAPVAAKVALRDLARYRSRSGAALGAICLALLMTGVVVVAATARYSDPFDWVGPNLASNVVMVYSFEGGGPGPGPVQCTPDFGCQKGGGGTQPSMTTAQFTAFSKHVAAAIGGTDTLPLYTANAGLTRTSAGRGFGGPVFVATPALLAHYGISPSSINPNALVLTARPGLTSDAGELALVHGAAWTNPNFGNGNIGPCPPGYCVPGPSMQYVPALPTGTSAPNTVLTMHAVTTLHLTLTLTQYLLTAPHDLTALQKQAARTLAAPTSASVETANSFASLDEVLTWSIAAGLLLALGVLAMTVGLIRAETASELRVLTAAGAGRRTRRVLTAVTAGSLGFVGAVLGVVTAYVLVAAFLFSNSANFGELTENVPFRPLGLMVFGLPILAALGGLCFSGREPSGIAHQPIE